MIYKIMPTSTRAMPLDCDSELFVNEYFECWANFNRSTTQLHQLVIPFLLHWEQMLTKSNYNKDISYITLCKRLHPISNPQDLLKAWVCCAQNTTSVKEELELIFFDRLRKLRYIPKKASPRMAEYVIAKDFRDRLKDIVMYASRHPIDIPYAAINFETMIAQDKHPDYFLIKNLGLDQWESYLLELMKLGMTVVDISALTNIPRKTFEKEENRIWHQLNQKWHQV